MFLIERIRHPFHGMTCTIDKVPTTGRWQIVDILLIFYIKCGLLLTFDMYFAITS